MDAPQSPHSWGRNQTGGGQTAKKYLWSNINGEGRGGRGGGGNNKKTDEWPPWLTHH